MSDEETERSDPAGSNSGEEMHIHRPRSAHSFREFLSEIGVIVVGVLIALALVIAARTLAASR